MHIDLWTLALQAINFLILIWLLARFLYRPVMAIVAARQDAAQKLLDDAEATRRAAEADRAEIAQARAGFVAERDKIVAAAQAKGEDMRHALIAAAKDDAAKLRRDAQAELARATEAGDRAQAVRAEDLALTIATKLLARLPPQATSQAFMEGLRDELQTLSDGAKAALKASTSLEIASPAALDAAAQAQIRQMLAATLQSAPDLVFRIDPEVIAGLELTSKDIVLRNSWREDLRRIREDLHSDGR